MKRANFFLLTLIVVSTAGAQPKEVPLQSLPEIFTYFTPGKPTNPAGADIASKSIMLLDGSTPSEGNGSAFLIQTFRDDNKVCVCLSGHQVRSYLGESAPTLNKSININRDIYLNYLGEDSIVNGEHYDRVTSFSKAFIGSATLLEYIYDRTLSTPNSTYPDAALLLIDKNQLPLDSFAMLGYNFQNTNWDATTYYVIGHPLGYPQRISDITYQDNKDLVLFTQSQEPYALAGGASGSPLLTRSSNVPGVVRGIYVRARTIWDIEGLNYKSGRPAYLTYSTAHSFTKITTLEQAIRNHCWKKNDSAYISTNGSYMQTTIVDNSAAINPYSQNFDLHATSDLTKTSASIFSDAAIDMVHTRVNANICNISNFSLPATNPGSSKPWQITIAAKQANISENFSYTASDISSLELSTVLINAPISKAAKTQNSVEAPNVAAGTASQSFEVYPNPSAEGIFNLSMPTKGEFKVVVFSTNGQTVYQSDCRDNPFTIKLPNVATGTYLLKVYLKQSNTPVYQTTLLK